MAYKSLLTCKEKTKKTPKATDIFLVIKTISCQSNLLGRWSSRLVLTSNSWWVKRVTGHEFGTCFAMLITDSVKFLIVFGMVFLFFVQTLLNTCTCHHVCFPFQRYCMFFLKLTNLFKIQNTFPF